METVQILFTGVYPKFNAETGERKMLYNYVVVGGDVEQFIQDKDASGYLSLQDDGEHAGKPRLGINKNLGVESKLQRVEKKDGSYDWYTDDTEAMLIASEIGSLDAVAKAEYAREEIRNARERAKATAIRVKQMRAEQAKQATSDKALGTI